MADAMTDPKTLEEAQRKRYGQWVGNPSGSKYDLNYCAYEVYPKEGWIPYQCCRKPVAGPGNLYCRQHAKKVTR